MTNIHDLRSFMQLLDEAGQLVKVTKAVNQVHELAEVAATIVRRGDGAVLFENVIGSEWPIFAGGVANQKRAALALGCTEAGITDVMGRVLEPVNGIPPVRVERAGWQANVRTGDEVDLTPIPLPTHSRGDGGAFITGGVIISQDPVSGRGNLSYNRMLRQGSRQFGFNVNEWRHVRQFMDSRDDPGAPFPIAIAIGLDPAIMIAAGVKTDEDELNIAGAIRQQGVPVCHGLTVEVDIPAEAEIVIEGYVQPREKKGEGPLAEFHGYHGEVWESPTVQVSAVCWRDRPIFQTIIPGWYEHVYIGNVLPREPLLRRFVRHLNPTAVVHIPPYANGFCAIVQIKRDNPGQPKNLAMAAMTAHINIKKVIVVDQDINIYDPAEVLWALTNRVDWSRDTFTVPASQGHEMDPTADQRGVHAKIGIDATYKRERREYGERVSYPPVDLSQYVQSG
ncbi:MAG TPA: UbiD family decarboxylase [Anaerolineae bacterium]